MSIIAVIQDDSESSREYNKGRKNLDVNIGKKKIKLSLLENILV